jgi:hypothetical protein
MYLVNTRPDICYAVSVLSQFMSQPIQTHWIATKHVLRYLRGTVGYGLRYTFGVDMRLQGYANADWAGNAVDRKSTSGCCFTLGSAMVSWCRAKRYMCNTFLHTSRLQMASPNRLRGRSSSTSVRDLAWWRMPL